MKEPFNLKIYLQNPEREVVTRGDKPVQILSTNYHQDRTPVLVSELDKDGKVTSPYTCDSDGKVSDSINTKWDLFFRDPIETKEKFLIVFKNVYGQYGSYMQIFDTYEEAQIEKDRSPTKKIWIAKVSWKE